MCIHGGLDSFLKSYFLCKEIESFMRWVHFDVSVKYVHCRIQTEENVAEPQWNNQEHPWWHCIS